ncbi:MAG: hypothetical protein ACRD16_00770 [Thermoanaerobaculia bacterium]
MTGPDEGARLLDPGLCGTCRLARMVRSDRGASFFRCERSDSDRSYARFPVLPVFECPGYDREPEVQKKENP